MDPSQLENLPDREKMLKMVESAQAAQKAQSTANNLISQAKQMTNASQREKMLQEAYDKEIEANGHSKMAKRLQSGTWQGLGFGGGIGAATGLGVGAGLGTVLGAITAVPMAGLGMLVGSATGAIHGPWIKLGGKEQKFEDADPNEVADALEQERVSQSAQEKGEMMDSNGVHDVPQPAVSGDEKSRRKPKKLEIRSQPKPLSEEQVKAADTDVVPQPTTNKDQKQRKHPKKLEITAGKADGSGGPPSKR